MFAILYLLLLQHKVSGQSLYSNIDSIVRDEVTQKNFNGCVLVISSNSTVYQQCYGYADYTSKKILTKESAFDLASLTKLFTASAVELLIQQKKLHDNDFLQQFFPGLPYPHITIHQLLTHTSGLPSFEPLLQQHWDTSKVATNTDVIKALEKYKPPVLFKAGTAYKYSNTGYVLLASIVEKISGENYYLFLQRNFFNPLGMRHTGPYQPKGANYALPFIYDDSMQRFVSRNDLPQFRFVRWMSGIYGDGNLYSTITDLALWYKNVNHNKILNKEAVKNLFTNYLLTNNQPINYGYGVEIEDAPGIGKIISHSGSWIGYLNAFLDFYNKDKTVVILSNNKLYTEQNAENNNSFINKIANVLLQ